MFFLPFSLKTPTKITNSCFFLILKTHIFSKNPNLDGILPFFMQKSRQMTLRYSWPTPLVEQQNLSNSHFLWWILGFYHTTLTIIKTMCFLPLCFASKCYFLCVFQNLLFPSEIQKKLFFHRKLGRRYYQPKNRLISLMINRIHCPLIKNISS